MHQPEHSAAVLVQWYGRNREQQSIKENFFYSTTLDCYGFAMDPTGHGQQLKVLSFGTKKFNRSLIFSPSSKVCI